MGMRKRNKEGVIGYGASNPLDRPDMRHAALHLLSPLLSSQALLSNAKPLLQPMYSGLIDDPPISISRLLLAIWTAVSGSSPGQARKASLALLDERAIESLLQLLSKHDIEPTTGRRVSEIALEFLSAVTAIPGRGICFQDQGWYSRNQARDTDQADEATGEASMSTEKHRGGLHNRLLSNVIRKIGSRAVDDNSEVGEWMVRVLSACPELVSG